MIFIEKMIFSNVPNLSSGSFFRGIAKQLYCKLTKVEKHLSWFQRMCQWILGVGF